MSDVGPRPLIPDDKELESKPDVRGLPRGMRGIVQSVAAHMRLSVDTANSQGNAVGSVSLQSSRHFGLANPSQVLQTPSPSPDTRVVRAHLEELNLTTAQHLAAAPVAFVSATVAPIVPAFFALSTTAVRAASECHRRPC
ncbi:hypothetical protein MVEN_00119000 [Mycena venus]|uniref:Uncharacterized protein n=1 Tax=Mycena venus TaxID=2733690 RepID=A0A8H7DEK5_9AGAR|nr:hypothetical protein MVEN_00119000 [Mycena venus]